MADDKRQSFAAAVLLAPVRLAVGVFVFAYSVLDELLFPVFRPLIRWLGRLALFERLGRAIGASPPYAVLVMLVLPLALIEPAKLFAVYLIATGAFFSGGALMLVAQVLSLMICERIFHAGREPLMRIGWFRVLIRFIVGLRNAAFGWIRSTAAWRWAAGLAVAVRRWLLALFGVRPPAPAPTPERQR